MPQGGRLPVNDTLGFVVRTPLVRDQVGHLRIDADSTVAAVYASGKFMTIVVNANGMVGKVLATVVDSSTPGRVGASADFESAVGVAVIAGVAASFNAFNTDIVVASTFLEKYRIKRKGFEKGREQE